MLGIMAAKKPTRGRPRGRKPTVVVQARCSPQVHAALEALAERNKRTKNAELLIALEKHLRDAGVLSEE
jgi:hypothetical protein